MAILRQLKLVLWKNWLVQKRKVCVTVFEIIIPVLFGLLLLAIRVLVESDDVKEPAYYRIHEIEHPWMSAWPIGYAPDNPATQRLVGHAEKLFHKTTEDYFSNVSFKGFDTEKEAMDYFAINPQKLNMILVVYDIDNTSTSLPEHTRFAIRPPSDRTNWHTKQMYPIFQNLGPRSQFGVSDYDYHEVHFLQRLVGESLIRYWMEEDGGGDDQSSISLGIYTQRMPYPPYIHDPMIVILQTILPIFLLLSFIISVVTNTKIMVYEKERKLKESMKLIGLRPYVHWLSWFITFLVYLVPAITLYALLAGLSAGPSQRAALAQTSSFLFFLFLLCYVIALITFCFMVSTFVQKANVGAVLSGSLFFAFYIPYGYVNREYGDLSKSTKLASCLLFNSALGLGAKIITIYEGTGEGVQFSNFHKPGIIDDNISFLECMLMLLVDSVIHLIITWYIDNVRPGEFGVPKPYNFPFTRSYWFGERQLTAISRDNITEIEDDHFESDQSNSNVGIQIKNLRKVFSKKVAVADMSLNMYEGQITALLGHNGAGKTTTMSMLTGFIPATSGSAVVNGYDIRDNIEGVRSSLGLCPQHDILFDTLTVREHLQFFAELKGVPKDNSQAEIETLAQDLGLREKLSDRSMNLSGGQKRKLSVAMALIGGSKVLILDEPSSGMDPAARRQTWTVLQNHREGRTMLLTTHYMDEADVLGDRIAIMAEGVVQCCGRSMFLKKLYGAGYHLVIVKAPSCDLDALTELIKSHISSSTLESETSTEVTFLLPENDSAIFPALFDDMDAKKEALGLSSFGTSATTMEEVFLKVGKEAATPEDLPSGNNESVPDDVPPESKLLPQEEACVEIVKNTGTDINGMEQDLMEFNKGFEKKTGLLLQVAQVKALVVKKALLTWRNRKVSLVQLILPVLFMLAGLPSGESEILSTKEPPLTFDLSKFGGTFVPYTPGRNPSDSDVKLAEYYIKQFSSEHVLEEVTMTKNVNYDNYTARRADELGTATYNKRMIIGLEGVEAENGDTLAAIAHFNDRPYHAKSISINMMMNAFLQYFSNGSHSLQSSIDPLPKTSKKDKHLDLSISIFAGMAIGILIVFSFAFLVAGFIYYIIKERQIGAKHMQTISGVSPVAYWMSTFIWDFIFFMIPCLLIICVFFAYTTDAFVGDGRWLLMVLLFVLYAWAVLPFTYALSFVFKSPPGGVVGAIGLSIATGTVTMFTVLILRAIDSSTEEAGDLLDWIFMLLFPNYNLALAFMNVYRNYMNEQICLPQLPLCDKLYSPCCPNQFEKDDNYVGKFRRDYLDMRLPGVGIFVLFWAINGLIYSLMVLLIDYDIFTRIGYFIFNKLNSRNQSDTQASNSECEDSDVADERQRLVTKQADAGNEDPENLRLNSLPSEAQDPLRLINITKTFGNFLAVDHICVGVTEKECFGLLGQNGAGKTTIFKMLTGDIRLTGGNAYLKTFDVCNKIKNVHANLGYCPQFDALLDQMTGRETLTMYARVRGIPETNVPKVVNSLLSALMLKPYAEKLVGNYSGGNKRKLSTAVALVGDPPFIMLDEPSAGLDPKARRQLWNILSQLRASGRTLVLTSHSMEECDALCTRIAIMVNGRFVCLGSPQHLKNKFGQGYTLVVKMTVNDDGSSAPIQPVVDFILQNFPETKVFDTHQGYIHFQVPDADVRLSKVFSSMEFTKATLNVQDYSVHQTTLEQVFLTFTKGQHPPKPKKRFNVMTEAFCCLCIKTGLMK